MGNMRRPSKTQLKQSLLEGLFDPRSVGPGIGITIETGNPRYFEIRAIEYIREAQQVLDQHDLTVDEAYRHYQEKMNKALSLIALAKIVR